MKIGPRTGTLLFLISVAACELLLSAAFDFGRERIVEPSKRFGHRLSPGQTVGEVGALERINAQGYRDREWGDPDAASRVVSVLGASVTYGPGVDVEEIWPRVLERELATGNVLNHAVAGYVSEQMVRVWEDHVRRWRPRVVCIELSPFSIRPMRSRMDPVRYPLRNLMQRSAIFDFVDRALRRRTRRSAANDVDDAEQRIRADPFDPRNEADWRAAFERMDGLRRELVEDGGVLVVVATPFSTQVVPDPAVLEPARPDQGWAAWAQRHPDVLWVDASGLLGDDAFLPDDPWHLSPAGHALVGGEVARVLRAAGH